MRFNIYKEARISLLVLSIVISICLLFYLFASMFTSMGYNGLKTSAVIEKVNASSKPIIIIDAGHGGEDPGAVSNNLVEKDLNLEIAILLNEILNSNGYQTKLTRIDDRLLYNDGEEGRKKYYDLRNREIIANSYDDAIFVSIHMNKFPASYCKGLQAFYSNDNQSGRLLAECIQSNAKRIQTDNKRVVADGKETIYLLEKLKMPAALVECGFISNEAEAQLFTDSDYKIALAMSIYCGIADFLENKK